jgi:poly-gamma-glutamate capsule biosynthesis protein CapA/YwtB (metallophosphatase superfamily)
MTPTDTPGRARFTNRTLAIGAAALWITAAALAGFYLWGGPAPGTAAPSVSSAPLVAGATVSTTSTTVEATVTTVPPTTVAPPEEHSSTTTSLVSSPTTTSTTEPPPLTVAAGGDVLGDRDVGVFIDGHGGEAVFAKIAPFLKTADIAFINLEGPISDKGTRASWKEYTFRGRTALTQGLVSAGIDVVSLANNHSVDYGQAALLETITRLDDAGVNHAGAGSDAAKASAPALLITPAGVVAILAYTDIIPGGFTATADTPGVNATTPNRKNILAAVAAAKKKADFVIVSFHWGTEYKPQANSDQRQLAHQVVDAGADLVIGHHPHVIQGLELYRDRLIAYSLGDFVWDHYSRETGETFVLRVTMRPQETPSVEVVPVYLDETTGVPGPVKGDHAGVILSRLARLSADLGLKLTLSGDRASFGVKQATP